MMFQFLFAQMPGLSWVDAIVQLGLATALAVFLVRWMANTISTKLESVEKIVARIDRNVTPNLPVNLGSEDAKRFIQLGLNHDQNRLMTYIARSFVWQKDHPEHYLRA